jgi:hypothetical protein
MAAVAETSGASPSSPRSRVREFSARARGAGERSALGEVMKWVGWLLQAPWMVAVLVLFSDAGSGMDAFLILVLGGLGLVLIWIVQFFVEVRVPREARTRRWALGPVLTIACAVFVIFGGSFWIRFLVSKSALDRFAMERSAGPSPSNEAPVRVGLFEARDIDVIEHGCVRFITSRDGMADDAGLAHSPDGEPPVIGEDSYSHLVGNWWWWHRSW